MVQALTRFEAAPSLTAPVPTNLPTRTFIVQALTRFSVDWHHPMPIVRCNAADVTGAHAPIGSRPY
jgi:hypothetical protein